jgi:hypothetical protein
VFAATVIKPHVAAQIGCVDCHAEHRGKDFRPGDDAHTACVACHNDANKTLYNGKTVTTPHGGTYGYPVVDGRWKWKGLDEEEWSLKQIAVTRQPEDSDDAWRVKQFHALHLYRVRAVNGLNGNQEGEMSCSSCHKSFNPIDTQTPRTTCAACHSRQQPTRPANNLINTDVPNCASCHVQHIRDRRHWNPSLLTARINDGQ